MMPYIKIISLILIVSSSNFVSLATSAERPDNTQTTISYRLAVKNKVNINTNAISCRLRVENNTQELQFLSRPMEEDISLAVEGLDKNLYTVSFIDRGFENLDKRGIYLRPKCAIETEFAKIEFIKSKDGNSVIPKGKYFITALWKKSGLPDVKEGLIEFVDEYIPEETADMRLNNYEYPLSVELDPSSETYYKGEPVTMTIRLQNKGTLPVCMENYFDRYKDYFEFEKKYAIINERVKEISDPMALISPEAIKGYIILLPEECLSVFIDASDEFKLPTEYIVSVNYRERIQVCPNDVQPYDPNEPLKGGTFPIDAKPYYTKRHIWPSNEVYISISDAPRVTTLIAQKEMIGDKQATWSCKSFILGIVSASLIFSGFFVLFRKKHL